MTPEHLPTEQYEAQLAEKVVRLQSMMAPFSDLVPEVFRSPEVGRTTHPRQIQAYAIN